MLGALAGDIVGSPYEFNHLRSKDFPLFDDGAEFTDESVHTLAVADALLHGHPPQRALYHWSTRYPYRGYGLLFSDWVIAGHLNPYDSECHGAAVRVSPAALLAHSLDDALEKARRVSEATHSNAEGIKGALATAHAIYLARCNAGAGTIRREIEHHYGYDLDRSVDLIRPGYRFTEYSRYTVPEAIVCALEAQDFEDALRNAVSLGGDADSLAAIAGAVAEARFGIPDDIAHETLDRLPAEMRELVSTLYSRSEYVHPVRGHRPAMPGSTLRRHYDALAPLPAPEGEETYLARLSTWEGFLRYGRAASTSFHAQAKRGRWSDAIVDECPALVSLVMTAWPDPDDHSIH